MKPHIDPLLTERATQIFHAQQQQLFCRTDRMFAGLMLLQWIGGVIAAATISPLTWDGSQSSVHPHVWLALIFGGLLAALPVTLAWRRPGHVVTRHVIAITQVMFSSLFIHISGGRIETHFHVFGSLAFLAFYRDWRVLIPATVVVAADHYLRGVYWPATVFGSYTPSSWRWLEHAAWVVFEDVVLILSCRSGTAELWDNAYRTAQLERMNASYRQRTVELEESYQSNNAIVETALDAVIGMDINGTITDWNSQAERTFGWTAAEAVGRPLATTIIPAAMRERHWQGLQTYRETGSARVLNRRIEIMALHRDGYELPVELAIAPIHSGESITFCAFVRDITERQQAAEALRRAKDAAESANVAKSAFLAHMSHEIRTPLNGILGFADVLLKLPPGASEAERRDYVGTIHTSGRHLLELINDVLDISKIEAGQMEVEMARCAPHEIVADVISILRVRAHEKGINLDYRWRGSVPETIRTDASRFRQLLMNLVGNGIKFTEKGAVEVVARVEGPANLPRLSVDVIDTGIGIAPQNVERIFEPFAQADESITRRFGGTGLGLAISQQIAEVLGGGVSVQSELGRGSTFTATIDVGSLEGVPLLDASVADVVPQRFPMVSDVQQTLPAANILLVEDGVTNRKLISLMLRRAGAHVETAENGQVGLDFVKQRNFDLVLIDMQMPVMDGYTATTEMRRAGINVPIIALTAHAMKGDEDRCRAAGCSDYLTKPIDSDRLLNAVACVLSSREVISNSPAPEVRCEGRLESTLPMDDADFREVVEEFIEHLDDKMHQMHIAAQSSDFEELAALAHWLKGAGGTAGFAPFTAPAAALHRLARESRSDAVPAALAELQNLCDRIEMTPLETASAY